MQKCVGKSGMPAGGCISTHLAVLHCRRLAHSGRLPSPHGLATTAWSSFLCFNIQISGSLWNRETPASKMEANESADSQTH